MTRRRIDSVSRGDIAAHLFMSLQRVRDLLKAGVLPATGTLENYRQAYIQHIRGVASKHMSPDGKLDLTAERAHLARAQTEKTQLEVDYLRGDALPRPLVTEVWQMHAAAVRSRFLGLTSKLKMLIPRLTYEEGEIVYREVCEILEELAGEGLPAEAKAAAVRHMRKYGKRH
jgi:phage terminase Nu1 subunit (DNA packaging protein)